MPEVLSASILIFVKIYGKTSICSACVCGRRYNWRMSSSSRKKNGDLSVEKHRTIGIYAPRQEYEIAMLLVTKGAEGVVVCYRGQVHHFAGMSVNCVDSTGREMRSLPGYSQVCPLRDYLQMREKCDELSISLNVAERLQ